MVRVVMSVLNSSTYASTHVHLFLVVILSYSMDYKYRVYSPSFEDMDEIVPSSQESEIELTAAELSKFIQNRKAAIERCV